MKLWRKAAGAIKDQNSILAASLSRRTSYRNPDLEAAIIKATSHNEAYVDYKNCQRVFAWLRTSPVSLKPLICALTTRMEKTQSWVVAIKGLMLMHGVFCCKTPAVKRIGRLPFDLANFEDGHLSTSKTWGYNAFIRSYFTFLDQRSALLYERGKQTQDPMVQELLKLQNWQSLLDLLIHIKPSADNMRVTLILESMDCVIIEIFDIYSRICNGIARVLLRIYSAGKVEASMAVKILQKATSQGEDLAAYFEFCREFGVFNATEMPKIPKIPNEDIQELERIISGVSEKKSRGSLTENLIDIDVDHANYNDKAMVVRDHRALANVQKADTAPKDGFMTIITDKWEVFDEDLKEVNGEMNQGVFTNSRTRNPFETPSNYHLLPLVPADNYCHVQEIPDFISF